MEAVEDIIGYEEISLKENEKQYEYFGLQVKGDSMAPDYKDKDNVIFKKQADCESGQNCAVMVNGDDVTFKKVLKKEDGIALQPINQTYDTVFYTNKEIAKLPVKILGVVKQTIRYEN